MIKTLKPRLFGSIRSALWGIAAMAIVCLLVPGQSVYAQSGTLTLPSSSTTLKQAFDEVDHQTDYHVVVNWNYLDPGKRVTLPAVEIGITQLLTHALAGTGHTWELVGRQIAIKAAPGFGKNADSAMVREDFNQMRPIFISDPWSRTQQPFENMVNTRVVKMSSDEAGRDSTGMAVVNFRVNSSMVERDYMNNARALDMLVRTFHDRHVLASMEYMVITAGSSPEGNVAANEELAAKRALAMKSYIMWKFPFLNRDMIYTFSIGEDWTGLRRLVEEDIYTPYRSEVLGLLDSYCSNDTKKEALKSIGGGSAYRYISRNMLPRLRGGVALSIHYKAEPKEIVVEEKVVRDTAVYVEPVAEPEKVTPQESQPEVRVENEKVPLLAVKTNLLFDAASAINVEVEIPIGKRWSVAGEWVFPWWLNEEKQHALQVGNGNLEVKYWLGHREERRQLTGWFVGVYGGGAYYDLEWEDKGYHGELWHGGLSGGYAHTISKSGNWRMEYTFGAGYMETKYRQYVPQLGVDGDWHLIRQRNGKRTWVGPTRAKVSLVWMLNNGECMKGGAK